MRWTQSKACEVSIGVQNRERIISSGDTPGVEVRPPTRRLDSRRPPIIAIPSDSHLAYPIGRPGRRGFSLDPSDPTREPGRYPKDA
jgi:hypothetical protein